MTGHEFKSWILELREILRERIIFLKSIYYAKPNLGATSLTDACNASSYD